MIRIFYGKNNIDLARFVFDEAKKMIDDGYSGAVLLVPDRYTLETERKAFSALNAGGLMDIEIMSFSRMAAKLLPRSEGVKYIDDLSRAMILRKVISENKENLRIFARTAGKPDFIRMMGNIIQDFKQNRTLPVNLIEALDADENYSESILSNKLREIALIYEAYEEEIKGKFFDTEDYLERLSIEIHKCDSLEGKAVFVHGFDFFSARLISVMEEIAKKCGNLTVILTTGKAGEPDYNLFAPLERTIDEVKNIAKRVGEKGYYQSAVPDKYLRDQNEEIAHLGRNLYAFPKEPFYNDAPEDINAFACDTKETETLLAARIIKNLVKNEGYRLKDIGVAVSDLDSRDGLIRRVFESEGIKYFDNSKYKAADNRFMQFILALCGLEKGYGRGEDLLSIAETGVFEISHDEKEILENYAHKYKVESYQWQRAFYKIDRRRKKAGEGEAELAEAERIRASLVGEVEALFEAISDCDTGGGFSDALFDYLKNVIKFEEKIVADSDRLKAGGHSDLGEATLQLWKKTEAIFERLSLLLKTYKCTREEFFEILRAGVEALEIGMIPATVDNVLFAKPEEFGAGEYKAVIFMGFCGGLVPGRSPEVDILSDRERVKLNKMAGKYLIRESDRAEKEKLAIYRAMTAPDRKLFISWYENGSDEDVSGKPSVLFETVKTIFPAVETACISEENLAYCASEEVYDRHKEENDLISQMSRAALYPGNTVSPTSLEAYAHCPFSHFLRYGIKADERKVFEAAPPEMGSIYHDIIMKFSMKLTDEYMWQSASPEKVEKIIEELAEKTVNEFAEGQLFEGAEGEYRISRIKSVCENTAIMVADHVQRGSFSDFYFEVPFGKKTGFPPIKLNLKDGSEVFVEGRIDRVDIAQMPEGTCVKIIDYKSGSASVDEKEIRSGYRLQLMLYMTAARDGLQKIKSGVVPAGVFYFKITEPTVKTEKADEAVTETSDKLEKKIKTEYRMDGVVVNEPWIIEAIDEDMGDPDFFDYSNIMRLRKTKSSGVKGTSKFNAISDDDFEKILQETRANSEKFAYGMMSGDVSIRPMKISQQADACKYCKFHSICTVDTRLIK